MEKIKKSEKTKEKIISQVSQNTYLSTDVVRDVINEYIKMLRKEIVESGRITIQGLFSVKTKVKKSHIRRDIQTGKTKEFPESEYLSLSLSKPLRDEFQALRKKTVIKNEEIINDDLYNQELAAILDDDEY